MTSWIQGIPLYSLAALSAAGVVVAGAIAGASEAARRRLQRRYRADEQLGEKVQSLRQEAARLEQELETRRRQLSEMEKEVTEAKRVASDTDRLRQEIAQLQGMKESLQPIRRQHETLQRERDRMASELQGAQERVRDAEARVRGQEQAAMAAQVREMEAADRLKSLQSEAEAVREGLQPAQEELEGRRAEIRDLEQRIGAAQRILERAELVQERAAAIDAMEAEAKTLATQLDDVRSQLRVAKTRLEEVQDDHASLLAKKAALDTALGKLAGRSPEGIDRAILQTRIAEAWKPVLHTTSAGMALTREVDGLERVQQYLKGLGLIFHHRTVYAFHTALKVAQEAPLVVLAGISGTGKSLLPQRYAEAIGMNFLLVPVQPRWDGPQDLLGFYNFLQEKLVATEFLRALVQMHPYPDEWSGEGLIADGSEFKTLKDQVLLVLLDEMNLARVEYYFSEFLSRLEIRRTIDEKDADQRRKVSIPLDAGPLPSGVHTPRVYPGRNTLFAGTMNEDETTQSLSDKVVDRANVMRFAHPKVPAAPEVSTATRPPEGRLSLVTWMSWQKHGELSVSDRQRIEEVTGKLNEALAGIGRPFGHRLTRALLTYAEMYPVSAVDRIDRALADQIEMRILPKLRGIDLEEGGEAAIDEIQSVLERTNDEELMTAVEDAKDAASGRFHWIGVSRATT